MYRQNILHIIFILILFIPNYGQAKWFQGKPKPEMDSFWLLETSYKQRLLSSNVPISSYSKWLLTSELGYMVNLNTKSSLGGSLYWGVHDNGNNLGFKARYRKWISEKPLTSVDLSLGFLILNHDNHLKYKFPGIIGSISLNINDMIALTLQQEIINYNIKGNFIYQDGDHSGIQSSTFIGIQFGSYYAIISSVIILGIYIIIGSSFSISIM